MLLEYMLTSYETDWWYIQYQGKNNGDTNKNQLFFHNSIDTVNKMKTFKMSKI